ncbi:sporulation membrane protein YtrI [Halalkalibacterium ligniniphilum]|uniref:sporulation membrane protein YtrI n=1 Tax=Halalkalibacterium ligniniphilum TaxID=1134413 RepID=UPI00034A67A1|nr:sporulation membrane protein YtrI [Halalkalibacterium ligniniphilum]
MRVPPYYRRPGWQRFFAGVIIGAICGWVFFLYNFGTIHEELVIRISKQQIELKNQRDTIEELRSEQQQKNEENQRRLTLQRIEVTFTNERKLRLNQLTLYELNQQAINELKFLEQKNIETVASMKDLMVSTIENKVFQINEHRYQLDVQEVYLFTTLQLYVEIIPSS